ncbi:unnamed protein product [Somion occarium]|uniref:Protein kinase domain-containing protein n=1 Tax=Somion occarium TaxID=3059160 RepID=A0ABP1CNB7_9APHY
MPSTVTNTDRSSREFIGAVRDEWQLYSNNASDYTIGPPVGFGASSVVYTAVFQPPGAPNSIPCALKVLDLDRLPPHSLRLIQRETQLMSLSKHPNVLRVRGTWTETHKLYIALRLMRAGSAADVMRYGWPGGMEEEVVRCILKQALEGLNYLHINGLIHRDVKAANLLVDDDGTVLLGDLGVAAFLWENEDPISIPTTTPPFNAIHSQKRVVNYRSTESTSVVPRHSHSHHGHRPRMLGKRKSFVGTPCWMAPEVINGKQYDASADIWSFGITALELTQGRAPRSRESPHSVLLHIVQDSPPKLDREDGPYKYSRAFADIVDQCLNKDPSKRPSAEDLLQMSFFRGAKKKGYLVGTILKDLPPLTQRQERRKQPSIMTHATMESWDFSQSPTTSVGHHAHRPVNLASESVTELDDEVSPEGEADAEVMRRDQVPSKDGECEEGAAAYAQRMRTRQTTSQHAPRPHCGSGSHLSSVSWVDDNEESGNESQVESSVSDSEDGVAGKLDGPETPSFKQADNVDPALKGPLKLESSGAVEIVSPSLTLAPSSTSESASKPLDVPIARAPSNHLAASPPCPSSILAMSTSNSPLPPSSFPPRRLWRKLTGRSVGEDKETLRRKAMNGMSGLVRTVSRHRTVSVSSSASRLGER